MEAEAKDEAKNYHSKEIDEDKDKDEKDESCGLKGSNYKKKILIGPKNN